MEKEYEGEAFDSKSDFPTEIQGVSFVDCTFVRCNLSGRRLRGCRFFDCEFVDIDASMMNITDSVFRGIKFIGCKLLGINWTAARSLDAVQWEDSILDDCCFQAMELPNTAWLKCRARRVDFSDCDLENANFAETNLRGSNFNGANMHYTSFADVSDLQFDPSTVKLKQTLLEAETVLSLAAYMGIKVAGRD